MGDEITRDRILARVGESASALSELLETPSNYPLADYVDPADAKGLVAALITQDGAWSEDDLSLILLIRDSFYEIRGKIGDKSEDTEHSIEQLLSAFDRLYVDLDRAIRATDENALKNAAEELRQMRDGPSAQIASATSLVEELRKEASAVAVSSYETGRRMNTTINILSPTINIDAKLAVEVIQNLQINVRRLSASAFSISMSLVEGNIFQGVFRFLHDSADKALEGIKDMLRSLKETYQDVRQIASDVEALADKGNRFVKLVGRFMKSVFGEDSLSEPDVEFGPVAKVKGVPFACALQVGHGMALIAGQGGALATVDLSLGRVANTRVFEGGRHIYAMAAMSDARVAFGTEDGLAIGEALTSSRSHRASFREPVVAVATMPWGNRDAIITGSARGDVRRFQLAGNLSQWSDGRDLHVGHIKIGRTTTALLPWGTTLVAASDEAVFFLDDRMKPVRKEVDVGFQIRDVCRLDQDHLVVAGEGNVAVLSWEGATTTRLLTMSASANYNSVRRLNDKVIVVGAAEGTIVAVEVWSSAEIGLLSLDFSLWGLEVFGEKILAFGGSRIAKDAATTATITWSFAGLRRTSR